MFCELLDISIEVKKSKCVIPWKKANPFLCFQPESPVNSAQIQVRHLLSLYQNKRAADPILVVNDKKIPIYKIFLMGCGYFENIFAKKEMLSKQKFETCTVGESSFFPIDLENRIVFDEVKESVVEVMLFFCYTSRIEENKKKNFRLILDLYQLGHFLLFDDLIDYCADLMTPLINIENFLFFAFTQDMFDDIYLLALIEWFLAQNHDLNKFNISHFRAREALETYSWIKKYGNKDLTIPCIRLIIDKLRLELTSNELFINLEQKSRADLYHWIDQYSSDQTPELCCETQTS